MASKSGQISIGIKKASPSEIKKLISEIRDNKFNMDDPIAESRSLERSKTRCTTFVAYSGKEIVGYITIHPPDKLTPKLASLEALYLKIGFEKKGIGSKLLGKGSAFSISRGAKEIECSLGKGYHLVNGKLREAFPDKFYEKTPFREFPVDSGEIIWKPKETKGKRRHRIRPKLGLAPQNIMDPSRIARRGRRP